MSNEKQSNNSQDNLMLFMLVAGLGATALVKNSDYLERWAWAHWPHLALVGIGIFYSIRKYAQWKFKMKYPEIYERELALKQMQTKKKEDDSNFR